MEETIIMSHELKSHWNHKVVAARPEDKQFRLIGGNGFCEDCGINVNTEITK